MQSFTYKEHQIQPKVGQQGPNGPWAVNDIVIAHHAGAQVTHTSLTHVANHEVWYETFPTSEAAFDRAFQVGRDWIDNQA